MEIQEAINTYIQSEEKRMSLGTSSTSSQQQVHPYFTNTGGSSIAGTRFNLDPRVEQARQQGLNTLQTAAGQYGGQLSQLQQSAVGNLPDWVNSQIAPLLQSQAQQRGNLQQDLSLRKLLGSSFGQQSQSSLNTAQQQALQNARAQAMQSGIGLSSGLAGQQFGAQQAVANALNTVAGQRLAQELGIFGLGSQGTTNEQKSALGLNIF